MDIRKFYSRAREKLVLGFDILLWRIAGRWFAYAHGVESNFRRLSLTCCLLLPLAGIGCGASPTSPSYTTGPSAPVPDTPRLTITDDIPGGQQILVPPRPVTFTVTTEGGTPPYEYQWRINNVLMRDWDQNQVLVWDGLTLDGRPTVSGRYTLVVTRRTAGDTQFASAALLNFSVQYR